MESVDVPTIRMLLSAIEDSVDPLRKQVFAALRDADDAREEADAAYRLKEAAVKEREKAEATVETLKRCVRAMAGDVVYSHWTDDDNEMRVLFLRAADDGDVDTVAAALGVGEE